MTKVRISFWDMDSIIRFMEITEAYSYKIELTCGNYVVDAKSMLAVFAMRTARNIELQIHSSQCDDLLKDLEVYMAQWELQHGNMAVC
ncbi:hypothetical protein AALB16_00890 [Lachnospiraceae bacterium 62-35]